MNQGIVELQIQLENYRSNREVAKQEGRADDVTAYDRKINELSEALDLLQAAEQMKNAPRAVLGGGVGGVFGGPVSVATNEKVEETPKFGSSLWWALGLFGVGTGANLATGPDGLLANWLDQSQQYFVTRPLTAVSVIAFVTCGILVMLRVVFPNTIWKDSGTRFNDAWGKLQKPEHVVGFTLIAVALMIWIMSIAISSPQ